MAHLLKKIRKRSTFIKIRKNGILQRGKAFNVEFLNAENLNNSIYVGFTATKKIGSAVKRNKAKRILRELVNKIIVKYGKNNSYYVLIAKKPIFEFPFRSHEIELKKLIS